MNSRLTFDFARKRERLSNFPEVRQCNNRVDGFEKACMSNAVKKITKKVGARMHPCLTSRLIGKRRDLEASTWTVPCMSSWSFRIMLSNVSGQPNRLRIANNPDLRTRSKAFVKSMNATHKGRYCSIHFAEVVLMWTPRQWLSTMYGNHIDSPAEPCLRWLAALEEVCGIRFSQ